MPNSKKAEDELEKALEDSFPASDPPSFNPGVTGPTDIEPLEKEAEKKKKQRAATM